jgi:hypothetical protein
MKPGIGMRKMFPGAVATNVVMIALGIIMAVLPLTPGLGGRVAVLLTSLGSAAFLAGFIGLVNVSILSEEYRRLTDQPFDQLMLLSKIQTSGIIDVFRNRSEGISRIMESLAEENSQFLIVGTSLKGLIGVAFDEEDEYSDVWRVIKEALQRKVKVNILLINPGLAHHRSRPEGRPEGEIETEIIENLIYLVMYKMENPKFADYLKIKIYDGTPTLFMMSTTRKMLINPYPYYATASNSFSLLIEGGSPIYASYYHSHYRAAWLDSKSTVDIHDDPKEAAKQIQELINMTNHDKNTLIIPDENKRNSMLQTVFSILQK